MSEGPSAFRTLAGRLFLGLRGDRLLHRAMGAAGVVLMFHRVRAAAPGWTGTGGLSVAPDRFRALLASLARDGWRFADLDAAVRDPAPGDRRPFVCLTFDDGYADNFEAALPIAREFEAPITVFVTTGFTDGTAAAWWLVLDRAVADRDRVALDLPGRSPIVLDCRTPETKRRAYDTLAPMLRDAGPEQRQTLIAAIARSARLDPAALTRDAFAGWPLLRTAARDPLVRIGAHTVTHPRLAALPHSRLVWEVATCRQRLRDELGVPVLDFAYPYGTPDSFGPREAQAVARAGFRLALATTPGLIAAGPRDPFALPRLGVGPADDAISARVRMGGAGLALEAVRSVRAIRRPPPRVSHA